MQSRVVAAGGQAKGAGLNAADRFFLQYWGSKEAIREGSMSCEKIGRELWKYRERANCNGALSNWQSHFGIETNKSKVASQEVAAKLEGMGLIEEAKGSEGRGHQYRLTEAGRDELNMASAGLKGASTRDRQAVPSAAMTAARIPAKRIDTNDVETGGAGADERKLLSFIAAACLRDGPGRAVSMQEMMLGSLSIPEESASERLGAMERKGLVEVRRMDGEVLEARLTRSGEETARGLSGQ